MTGRYLCDGGSENCGGPRCLEILAAQEKSLKEANDKKEETLGSSQTQNAKEEATKNSLTQEENLESSTAKNSNETKQNTSDSSNSVLGQLKGKANNIIDNLLGPTQEACEQKQASLDRGIERVEEVTLGACIFALASEGTAVPADIACGGGIGVSIVTEAASQTWKGHCSTLPSSSTLPPK